MLYKSNTSQEGDEKFVCFLKEQRLEGEKQKMWYVSQQSGEIVRVEPLEGLVLERVKIQENDVNKLDEGQSKAINCLHSQLLSYIDRHYASPYAATCTIFHNQYRPFHTDSWQNNPTADNRPNKQAQQPYKLFNRRANLHMVIHPNLLFSHDHNPQPFLLKR